MLPALLNTLSEQLSAAGRLEDALRSAKDSVELCRNHEWNQRMPDSLYFLARRYADKNLLEDALQAANESAGIPRKDMWLSDHYQQLARVLGLIAKLYSELGRNEEEKALKEAETLKREAERLRQEEDVNDED
ncbi:hypothetical protein BDQ17DRAFT_1326158 [Cyathus striatus]|nr:hypothetical protein BDQ17DRAFT_1326158 [Cyathus striatus]